MWSDFKAFISRGNVLDLAIGVIIGAAFGKIITTVVDGIIMPPIGYVLSGIDFKTMFYDISGKYNGVTDPKILEEAIKGGAPLIRYGQFITDILQFLIVAFIVFLIARWALTLFKGLEPPPAGPSAEETLLTEIRDLLKDKKAV